MPDQSSQIELLLKVVTENAEAVGKLRDEVDQLGKTATTAVSQTSTLSSSLSNLENQATKTGQATKTMADNMLNIRNLYFASFLFNQFRNAVEEVGGAFIHIGAEAAAWNREVQNVQIQFGLTNQETVGLELSLKNVGKDINDVQQGLRMFTLRMYEAEKGSGHGADAMAKLGYNTKQAHEIGIMPIGQSLNTLIERMQTLGSTAERNTAAVAFFGRSAVSMMPVIEEGLAAGRAQAELFQMTMTSLEQQVSNRSLFAFREFSRSVEALGHHFGLVSDEILGPMAHAVGSLAEALSSHIKTTFPIMEDELGKQRNWWDLVATSIKGAVEQYTKFSQVVYYAGKIKEIQSQAGELYKERMAYTMIPGQTGPSEATVNKEVAEFVKQKIAALRANNTSGTALSGPGLFGDIPAGPMTSLEDIDKIDATFDTALSTIERRVQIKAITLSDALNALIDLVKKADTTEQVSRAYAAMSKLQDFNGGIPNPFRDIHGNLPPGAPTRIEEPTHAFQPKYSNPPQTGAPTWLDEKGKEDFNKAMMKGGSLDVDQQIKEFLASDRLTNKLDRLLFSLREWHRVIQISTDDMERISESTLMWNAGLEVVRENLFSGGDALYDFATRLGSGLENSFDSLFHDLADKAKTGAVTIKSVWGDLIKSILDTTQREAITSISKMFTKMVLGSMQGGGGGGIFSVLGPLASVILGSINPILGLSGFLFSGGLGGIGGGGGQGLENGGAGGTDLWDPNTGGFYSDPNGGSNMTTRSTASGAAQINLTVNGGYFDTADLMNMSATKLAPAIQRTQAEGAARSLLYGS